MSQSVCCGRGSAGAAAAAAATCFDSIFTRRECCFAGGWARLYPVAETEPPRWDPPWAVEGGEAAASELLRSHPSFSKAQRAWEAEMQNSSTMLSEVVLGHHLRFFMFKRSVADFGESTRELLDDEYRLRLLEAPRGETPLVIDIGASIGILAVLLSKLWGGTRVVAVEPVPANYRYLLWNIRINNAAAYVWPLNIAVGATPLASKAFYYSPTYPRMSQQEGEQARPAAVPDESWRGGWMEWQVRSEVQQVMLAELLSALDIRGPVHLLKVDCEGCEWGIFSSPTWERVRHRVRHVTAELHKWALEDTESERRLEAFVQGEICQHRFLNGPDFYMCSTV